MCPSKTTKILYTGDGVTTKLRNVMDMIRIKNLNRLVYKVWENKFAKSSLSLENLHNLSRISVYKLAYFDRVVIICSLKVYNS